ncbi:phosphoserine aminotransferase [Lophiostoma macrostomum CBS 122681]|uniref:Phosphoserine aminotransferase n=1 Tax=Lophiostoma macrostomum CBS 122681 TaxID=1314788 RepID=A0A6A6SUA1_9PLEO|nr:phosphoserine aminotransferase [Lophiostoma macrostomum CBS 122681]
MAIVAVAGGTGDLGSLIVEALLTTGKHEVYILSRKSPDASSTVVSPTSQSPYQPIIQTNYESDDVLARQLSARKIDTIICAVSLDFDEPSEAQLLLIRAAVKAKCVKRFIPSEFNVDYDLGDDVLPYSGKKYHVIARRELEKTNLEFTYIYTGFFMDYLGMPYYETKMRQLYILLDAAHRVASIPGDGLARIALTCTKDVARYIAAALDVPSWPRVLTVAASHISTNELVALAEKCTGEKLKVEQYSIEDLRSHKADVLPSNENIASHFPEGMDQLRALLGDLSASIALASYDFSKVADAVDLVKYFQDDLEPPLGVEEFIAKTWTRR